MKLTIELDLPDAPDIIAKGCAVPIARKGEKWSNCYLGKMHNEKGVYIIHHAGIIKYVGKTDGPTMTFAARLRRHFGEVASHGKHTYPKLSVLEVPPSIMVLCLPLSEIKDRMTFNNAALMRPDHLVAIFEAVMIQHLDPEYQRHAVKAVLKYMEKRLSTSGVKAIIKILTKGASSR